MVKEDNTNQGQNQKTLYLYDFDGTLTFKDTYLDFLKFSAKKIGKSYTLVFVLFLPLFVLMKLSLIDPGKVKGWFFQQILKNQTRNQIEQLAREYFVESKDTLFRPGSVELITSRNQNPNNRQYIVSASIDLYLKPFADWLNVGLLCTEVQFENDILTGNLQGENCVSMEKRNRIIKNLSLSDFSHIVAYGDTYGDYEMLQLAKEKHYKPFR